MENWLARKLAFGLIIGGIGTVVGVVLYIYEALATAFGWH